MTKLSVWLDDSRDPPKGWIQVKTVSEAIDLLKTGRVENLSLDHDLGDPEFGTGYDVLCWLEDRAFENWAGIPDNIAIHSHNFLARFRMQAVLDNINYILEHTQLQRMSKGDIKTNKKGS